VRAERRADAALLYRPFDVTSGFDTEELCTEGQVAVLPAGHPLTARVRLRMTDVSPVDAPGVTTVIAWPPHSRSRALAGLIRAATRL
jgi:DNA-binding transcriptional LysR family regulator